MNILVLNYRDRLHPLAGGAEVHLHRVFSAIVARGHRVVLVSAAWPDCTAEEIIDGIHTLRMGRDWNFNWLVWFKLPHIIREQQIDLVVEDLNKLPFYSHWRTKIPVVTQFHHLWGSSIFHEAFAPLAFYVWLCEKSVGWFYRRQKCLAVSPSTAQELVELGVPETNIQVIYNGFDADYTPTYNPADKWKQWQERGEGSLIWVGRLRKYKGVDQAIQAFAGLAAKYPGLSLHLVGSGPEQERLQKEITRRGLQDQIVMHGFVAHEEKQKLLDQSLILMQTSRKEGWGLTVIEANACGIPVLASDVAGLRDSVKSGTNGWLYPSGEIRALQAGLDAFLQSSAEEYEGVCGSAREWAASFNWETAATETLKVLEAELDSFAQQTQANQEGESRP